MPQALHIFRKDVFYLRYQIALFIALAAFFAVADSSPIGGTVEILVILSGINLTARVVHAETIAGTTQFWITRPYEWRSLLLEKLLFIALFVDLPIGIARLVALAREGFPLLASLPALVWSQGLIFAAALPVAALAAMTGGLVEFSFVVLGIALVTMVLELGPLLIRIPFWPLSVEWIQVTLIGVALVAIAAVVLRWQYKDRRTGFSRLFAAGATAAAASLYFVIPLSAGLGVQSWFSRESAPTLRIAVDVGGRLERTAKGPELGSARVPVSIRVSGVAAGTDLRPDAFNLSLQWPNGRRWSGNAVLSAAATQNAESIFSGSIAVPWRLISETGGMRASLRGSLYLTLFGEAESRVIPYSARPSNAQDGMQCFYDFQSVIDTHKFSTYRCRNFFGWPSRLVSVSAPDDREDFTKIVSYSPFPAGPELHSEEARYTALTLPPSGQLSEVTIVTKKPLAHFHRVVEASGVRLEDRTAKAAPAR